MARRRRKATSPRRARYQFGAIPLCPCSGGQVSGLGGVQISAGYDSDESRFRTDRADDYRWRSGIEPPGGNRAPLIPLDPPLTRTGGSSGMLKTLAVLAVTGVGGYLLYKRFVDKTLAPVPVERNITPALPPGTSVFDYLNRPDYVTAPRTTPYTSDELRSH